ncbi:hypothetical protein LC593_35745 [Nostoc sp. CHAB 5844]|nr:hypothetical protein [Nostoc sp. CHAB 5844]
MTYISTYWTKKHTDLAISKKLTKNAWAMWEWLVHEGLEGKTDVIDIRDFNHYVAKKTGKPLDNRTIKSSADRLMEAGIVRWDNFSNFIRKVTVKLIRELLPPKLKKSCNDCNLSANDATLDSSNPPNAVQGGLAEAADLNLISQIEFLEEGIIENLESNIEQCEQAGIYFDSEDAVKVLAWEDVEEVRKAIKLFFKRGGHEKIKNPEGWLRRCLDKRWFDKPKFSFIDSLLHLANLVGIS